VATTNLGNFVQAVNQIIDGIAEDVSERIEDGLDRSQDYLKRELKKASPVDTGEYAASWKTGASGRGYRRIINDRKVKWRGRYTHLAGILEYSTNHSRPHIETTRRNARRQIIEILKESIGGKNG